AIIINTVRTQHADDIKPVLRIKVAYSRFGSGPSTAIVVGHYCLIVSNDYNIIGSLLYAIALPFTMELTIILITGKTNLLTLCWPRHTPVIPIRSYLIHSICMLI